MFDKKNDVARNKKRADAIVYAGAADEVVLTQSDFESEEEGTVKYYAQIHLQVWQNSVCTGQGNLPLTT